jgi:N-methylhydantoinase B/oxoprolinase/acetone carboxylase alpha subunit
LIVSPATLLRWHRDIVRRCWARKSQHKRPGRPELLPAGNVETSMATAGSLYAALGVQAEVAGTMNNLTFGNEHRQYYETIGSESGAGDGFGRVGRTDPHDQLAPH